MTQRVLDQVADLMTKKKVHGLKSEIVKLSIERLESIFTHDYPDLANRATDEWKKAYRSGRDHRREKNIDIAEDLRKDVLKVIRKWSKIDVNLREDKIQEIKDILIRDRD